MLNRIVITDDSHEHYSGDCMQFRLTYEGKLRSSQDGIDSAGLSSHKQEIRKKFHPQLRRLWNQTQFLKTRVHYEYETHGTGTEHQFSLIKKTELYSEYLAKQFSLSGYNFVPLVVPDLCLFCSINILFLRPEAPGSIIQSGDIDNRIKTLFDALRKPKQTSELGAYDSPTEDEKPFYCLLEDDKLISGLSVETDLLLEPVGSKFDDQDARLVITVKLEPYRKTVGNLEF